MTFIASFLPYTFGMGFIRREYGRWQWAWTRRRAGVLYPTIGAAVLGALRAAYPALLGRSSPDWQAIVVQGVLFAIVVNAAMVLFETIGRRWSYWRVVAREADDKAHSYQERIRELEVAQKTTQERRDFVKSLVGLRTEGLHAGNAFNNESRNPNALPVYRDWEKGWHERIRATMEQFGCPSNDISRVSDLTEREIMAHAPQEPKIIQVQAESPIYNQRWLMGLIELRVQRLQEIIDKYNPD
jgi:hypothetical protein